MCGELIYTVRRMATAFCCKLGACVLPSGRVHTDCEHCPQEAELGTRKLCWKLPHGGAERRRGVVCVGIVGDSRGI